MAELINVTGDTSLQTSPKHLLLPVQDEVVSSLMSQLPAVDVEDLPGLVKYIIGAAGSSNAEQVHVRCLELPAASILHADGLRG
jgi:hypothetical protein